MQGSRQPPYDVQSTTDTMINGTALINANKTTGTLLINLKSGPVGASYADDTASVGILELGPPARNEMLTVMARVSYKADWGTWTRGWRATTKCMVRLH